MAGFPAVLAFLLIYIFPMGMTMVYSFLENSFSKTPVGFDNYVYVWGKPSFQQALQNTASLTAVLLTASMALALLLAYLLWKHPGVGKAAAAVLLLPLLVPSGAITPLWQKLFDTSPFSSDARCYAAITSLFLWKYAGAGALILRSGLDGIAPDVLNAASMDGAGPVKSYLQVCLPMLRREISLTLLLFLMFAFRIYKESYLLFGEYPSEKMYLIQHYMNNQFMKMNFQYVAVSAVSLATLSLATYALAYAVMRKKEGQILKKSPAFC